MSSLTRALDGENLIFDLTALIEELRKEEGYTRNGRTGRTLVKAGHLRLTLTLLADGVEVGTHHADTPMTLQVLQGHLRYRVGNDTLDLKTGEVLFFGPGHAQDIAARGDTALLITIMGAGDGAARGGD